MRPKLLWIIIALVITYVLYKNISTSVFLNRKDRVNLLFYSAKPTYYSLGINDVSYLVRFPVNLEIMVPGGYGYYRVGALGKLVTLEKKPEILKKTFSAATFSFIDLYFFPKTTAIYYADANAGSILPVWADVLFHQSNANFIDRLLVLLQLVRADSKQLQIIDSLPVKSTEERRLFDDGRFHKQYQGIFYKKTYRNIKDNVQLLYTKSYATANLFSQMIEGEGIRVVDISQNSKVKIQKSKCLITYNKDSIKVASDLQKFFGCRKREGQPTVSDIIIILGSLEDDWAVN